MSHRSPRPARQSFFGLAALALCGALSGCTAEPTPAPTPTATPAPTTPAPSDPPAVPADLEAFRPLLGKTLAEAKEWLAAHETLHEGTRVLQVRAERIDGEGQMLTQDFRSDRLNVDVTEGRISALGRVG